MVGEIFPVLIQINMQLVAEVQYAVEASADIKVEFNYLQVSKPARIISDACQILIAAASPRAE